MATVFMSMCACVCAVEHTPSPLCNDSFIITLSFKQGVSGIIDVVIETALNI